jgi:hypothetical protein
MSTTDRSPGRASRNTKELDCLASPCALGLELIPLRLELQRFSLRPCSLSQLPTQLRPGASTTPHRSRTAHYTSTGFPPRLRRDEQSDTRTEHSTNDHPDTEHAGRPGIRNFLVGSPTRPARRLTRALSVSGRSHWLGTSKRVVRYLLAQERLQYPCEVK